MAQYRPKLKFDKIDNTKWVRSEKLLQDSQGIPYYLWTNPTAEGAHISQRMNGDTHATYDDKDTYGNHHSGYVDNNLKKGVDTKLDKVFESFKTAHPQLANGKAANTMKKKAIFSGYGDDYDFNVYASQKSINPIHARGDYYLNSYDSPHFQDYPMDGYATAGLPSAASEALGLVLVLFMVCCLFAALCCGLFGAVSGISCYIYGQRSKATSSRKAQNSPVSYSEV